jgi:hypothetical protein
MLKGSHVYNSQLIYVEIEGADGVLQVCPGGRKVFMSASKGKVYERWRRRLTPDGIFGQRKCAECGELFLCTVKGCCDCELCGDCGGIILHRINEDKS